MPYLNPIWPRKVAEPYYSNEDGPPGKVLARLRRAFQAFESGQQDRMFRGVLIEDLSDGLRTWLINTGQLKTDGTD